MARFDYFQDEPQESQDSGADIPDFLRRWGGRSTDTDPQRSLAVQDGAKRNGTQSARILEMAGRTGLPHDLIERNLDQIEGEVRKRDFDLSKFRNSPIVADWISKSPYAAGTILGDPNAAQEFAKLGKLERFLTMPSSQWPRSDATLMQMAKKRVERRLKDPMTWEHESVLRSKAAGLDTLELVRGNAVGNEFRKLKESENYISGEDSEGFLEYLGRKNWYELLPFVGDLPDTQKNLALLGAVKALENGTATEEEVELVQDFKRLADAEERRGRGFLARTADIITQSVPFAVELGTTSGIYSGVKAGVRTGLQKLVKEAGKEGVEALLRRGVNYAISSGVALIPQTAISGATSLPGAVARRRISGDTELDAWGKSITSTLIESGTERISGPLGRLFGWAIPKLGGAEAKGLLKRAIELTITGTKKLEQFQVGGVATEFLEERAADALNVLIGEKYPGILGADPLAEIVAFGALPAATLPAAAILKALAPKSRLPDIQKIEMNRDAWNAIAESAKDSNLFKTAPAEAEKLIEKMTTGDVTVPIADYNEFYQKQGVDPRMKAAEQGISRQYTEALQTGSDLVIPRAKAVTKIAATEDGKSFGDIVSWTPGEMSKREADEALKEKPKGEEVKPDAIQESADNLQKQLTDTLVKEGKFREDQASAYATQMAAFYRVQGLRAPQKMTADELFKQFPVTFSREGFKEGGFTQPNVTEKDAQAAYVPRTKTSDPIIRLFQKANLSSVVHESGHHYLEILSSLAGKEGADKKLTDDVDSILKWFGTTREKWGAMSTEERRPFHEKWATANEIYAMEGKAPSSALKRVFLKFWRWLTWVYKSRRGLEAQFRKDYGFDVDFNPAIAGVMDRMLATDEEIQATQEEMQDAKARSVWENPEKYGMGGEAAGRQLDAIVDSKAAFHDSMRAKFMEDIKRRDTETWKELREKVKADIRADVNKEPAQIAYFALSKGTTPEGGALPAGMVPTKLRAEDIKDHFGGVEVLKSLRALGVVAEKKNQKVYYPDVAAEQLGFTSGKELVSTLLNMEEREHKVERLADDRMKELYPSFFDDQDARADEAMDAFHNEKRGYVMRKELEHLISDDFAKAKGLIKKLTRRLPSEQQVKDDAEQAILSQNVRSLHPDVYRKAERNAGRAAIEAFTKGDWDTAFDAHLQEYINYERYRAASAHKKLIQLAVEYTKKFASEKVQGRLGKAGYLEQIQGLLSRFGLAPKQSREEKADRKTLEAFIKEKVAEGDTFGEEVYADAKVLNEQIEDDYRNLSVGEFLGMIDTVKQLDHTAKQLDEFKTQEERVAFTEAKNELVASIRSNIPGKPPPPLARSDASKFDKFKHILRAVDAGLIKTEQLVEWIDNKRITGPAHRLIWDPIEDAQTEEYDLTKEVGAKIAKAVLQMPEGIRKRLKERIDVPGYPDGSISRKTAIGLFLNLMNSSNSSKMFRGEAGRVHNGRVIGLTEQQIRYAVDQLTKQEMDFAQSLVDTMESLWPKIAALQKELTGLEPKKIEATPIQTKYGTYRGGYVPMMYDSRFMPKSDKALGGEVNFEVDGKPLFEHGYTRATTPQSHVQERNEAFAAPVDFDTVNRLPRQIAGVIKDLTHRKAVLSINKFLADSDVKDAISSHLGEEYYKRLKEWLKQVVNDRNMGDADSISMWTNGLERLRLNVALGQMGFKASVMASQSAGLAASAEVIGADWLAKGIAYVSKNPAAAYKEMIENNGDMRHRRRTIDRDLRAQFQKIEGKEGVVPRVQEASMAGVAMADMMVSLPTYWGGHLKQLEETPDNVKAAHRAGGRAVRQSQGAGGAKDLTAIQASRNTLIRYMTMYYSWAAAAYSRYRDIGRDLKRGDLKNMPKHLAWLAARAAFLWPIAGTIAAYASGKGPDDDESFLKWWTKNVALYPLMTIPGVRDIANALVTDYDYQLTPIGKVLETGVNKLKQAGKAAEGKLDIEKAAGDLFEFSGYILGLPTSQTRITGEYLKDMFEGDVEPESWDQLLHDVIYRRPRERNRD